MTEVAAVVKAVLRFVLDFWARNTTRRDDSSPGLLDIGWRAEEAVGLLSKISVSVLPLCTVYLC
jgi:hypothetical protein